MMNLLDGIVEAKATLPAQSIVENTGAAHNGVAVDVSNAEGSILAIADAADMSTSDTVAFTVEHSASGTGNWTAIPAAALFDPATGVADTFDNATDAGATFQTKAIRKEQVKRYLRGVATAAGTSVTAVLSFHFVYSRKYTNFSA